MAKPIDKEILICPKCKESSLLFNAENITCNICEINYPVSTDGHNKIFFSELNENDVSDFLDKIKHKMKKHDKLYNFLIDLISPVCTYNIGIKKFIKKYVKGKNVVALNLGSGNKDLDNNISNIDIFRYKNVDMTAELTNLPIKDNTVDVIINIAVLEHVPNPGGVISEFYRVLKSGGKEEGGIIFCYFPFIQGFHASPDDFSRMTLEGLKIIFKDFEILEIRDAAGPTSGFLWIFQEYLAILLSFGSKFLHALWSVILMLLTFPLKFLDILLVKHPLGKNISSGFLIIARKP